MGWAYGIDEDGREIGYGVRATCDHSGCTEQIDRGLAYVCGTMHGGENGCGRYFCYRHREASLHDCPCLQDCAAGEHCWSEPHTVNGETLPRTCHVCLLDENELPCPPGQHQWKSQLVSTPDVYERVCYCTVCGMEKTED